MAYKQKSSPLNKHNTGRDYNYKEAYNKNLTDKSRLHYLENARHDAPNHAESEYLSEGGDVIDETAQNSALPYKSPLSFMSKHSNSGRNSGSPLHDDYFIGESPEEIAKADKWRKDNPVDWGNSDNTKVEDAETMNDPVDETATGSGAAHEAKWKSANTASGNDLNTQVGIRNKSAKGTEAYVGSQNKINKYLGNKTVHTFSPKTEAGNVTGGGRPTFSGQGTSASTSKNITKNLANTSIVGKPKVKGGKPTFTGQGTSTGTGNNSAGEIANISVTEKQSGKNRRKSRKDAISSTMETSGMTKRQATRSVKSSSAADKYKFSGKERFAGRALRKSNRLAKDDISVGGLENKLKGSKKLIKK